MATCLYITLYQCFNTHTSPSLPHAPPIILEYGNMPLYHTISVLQYSYLSFSPPCTPNHPRIWQHASISHYISASILIPLLLSPTPIILEYDNMPLYHTISVLQYSYLSFSPPPPILLEYGNMPLYHAISVLQYSYLSFSPPPPIILEYGNMPLYHTISVLQYWYLSFSPPPPPPIILEYGNMPLYHTISVPQYSYLSFSPPPPIILEYGNMPLYHTISVLQYSYLSFFPWPPPQSSLNMATCLYITLYQCFNTHTSPSFPDPLPNHPRIWQHASISHYISASILIPLLLSLTPSPICNASVPQTTQLRYWSPYFTPTNRVLSIAYRWHRRSSYLLFLSIGIWQGG